MKRLKRSIAILFVLIMSISVVAVGVEAASVGTTTRDYGYMMPTDSKYTKTVSAVKLYGTYDYLNFYIDAEYDYTYFFYEIYLDKNYTKLVTADYVYCGERGTYTWSPLIKLKGIFKSGTYYCITYGATMDSDGNIKLSTPSVSEFKLVVDRTTAFNKQVVLLKNVKTTVDGPQITWYKHSSAATKYVVYRRSLKGTKWTQVGTVNASTLTFTDKSIKDRNGKYVYTVKALNKSGAASRYQFSGLTCIYAKAPIIKSVSAQADNKIKIEWENVSAHCYNVYRKTNGGKWELIRTTGYGMNTTNYTDTAIQGGNNYEYTVRAIIYTDDGIATSAYRSGSNIDYVAAPALNSVKPVDGGLAVSWSEAKGAKSYTIYRRPFDKSAGWTNLGNVTNDTFTFVDETATENTSYIYTVRSEGTVARGSFLNTGGEYVVMKAPEDLKATVEGESLKLTWGKVPEATDYEIYLQNAVGEWELLTKVSGLRTYTFRPDRTGELKFRVRGVYKDRYNGEFSEDLVFEFYPGFVNFLYENRAAGNYLSWKPNARADKYNVYRAVINGDAEITYELIETIIPTYNGKNMEYIDGNTEDGITYEYIVKGVYNGVEQPDYCKARLSRLSEKAINRQEDVKFIQSPYSYTVEMTVAEENVKYSIWGYDHKNGTWKKLHYQIFDGVINIMAYNLATPDENGEYVISVVYEIDGIKTAIDANLHKSSFYYGGFSGVKPQMTATGVKVSWQPVKNAKKYIVEYFNEVTGEDGSVEIPSDNSTSYSAILKTNVYHQNGVRMKIKINAIMSEYQYNQHFVGVETERAPKLLKAESQKSSSIKLYWEDDEYIHNYRVYRKAEGETKWTYLKNSLNYYYVNETIDGVMYATYVDTSVKDGVKYTYTVASDNNTRSSGNWYYLDSHYYEEGVSAKSLSTPTLNSATRTSTGVTVKWGKVTGADGYYVYRKTANSGWSRVGTIKNGSTVAFTDKTAKTGTTYTYTVKAYSGSNTSAYNKTGIKCK